MCDDADDDHDSRKWRFEASRGHPTPSIFCNPPQNRRLEATRRLRFLGPTPKWTVLKGLEDNLGEIVLRPTPKWTVLKGLEEDLGEPEASILALF